MFRLKVSRSATFFHADPCRAKKSISHHLSLHQPPHKVLAYAEFLKPFEIYTDAFSTQLGAVITQDNRPIAFFSRKLSETQQKYSVTEIELLAIVETLQEFKGML